MADHFLMNNPLRVRYHWTREEDEILRELVELHAPNKDWQLISQSIPGRTPKSCRTRWSNQISPQVTHRAFTPDEDRVIFLVHDNIGKKWARIAQFLPGRTANLVRNNWKYKMKRKYSSMMNKEFNDFMNQGSFRAGFGYFVNPFNPTGDDTSDSSEDDPLTLLSLATPGLGLSNPPVQMPVIPASEPVNLELSLALV
ncbi:transcription factor MYB44-like [Bidens hawaiensis]|uniref:transcription factor MYB44-like n=1 Tax=Bidens hawaiensis TaxID=980011 RepID=UPI004048FEB4